MAYIREVKRGNAIYLVKVQSVREEGKVKQEVLEYIGKKENGQAVIKTDLNEVQVSSVKRFADIKVLIQLARELKLDSLLGRHYKSILAIVIAHLLCKGSILKISSWVEHTLLFEQLGTAALTTNSLYEALDHLQGLPFERIESALTNHWAKLAPADTTCFVLDVTDTYFAGSATETKRRKGKDGKVSRLLQVGLVVSFENGFPILHKSYEGNLSTIKIFGDLLGSISALGLTAIVLDRGFYSEENVKDLRKLGMEVIVGLKQTPGIQKQFLDKIDREAIYRGKNQVILKETIVYAQHFAYLQGRLIVLYNPKLEVLKRDKMIAEGAGPQEVKYVGYSLLYHTTKLDTATVVSKYYEKDIVERSFKSLKGEVQLHPIRLWLPQRIEAHVKLCYLSLCLLALIGYKCRKLNLSATKVLDELQYIYKVHLEHAKTKKKWDKVVTLTNQQKQILKALKCSV
jgi:transposase